MLALSPPADAKVVYTPVHRVIGPHHSYKIDLNHDKITDFTISNFAYCLHRLVFLRSVSVTPRRQ